MCTTSSSVSEHSLFSGITCFSEAIQMKKQMQEIEALREQLLTFKLNGANPILMFANATVDMDILKEVFLQEKEQLMAEYNKDYNKYSILEKCV